MNRFLRITHMYNEITDIKKKTEDYHALRMMFPQLFLM